MKTMVDSRRIDELRRRVELDPASIAFAALADEYLRAGQIDDAIATCLLGLKRHPSYLSARVTLGRALIEAGRLDDAESEFAAVLQGAPENLAAIRGLAGIRDRRQGPDRPSAAADDPQVRALEAFLGALLAARRTAGGPSS